MKKQFLIAAGIVALAMTACQSEEPIGSEQPDNGPSATLPTDGQYIAINLYNSDSTSGRASFTYEEGSDKENAIDVERLRFYFFDEKGEPFMMTGTNINGDVDTAPDNEGNNQPTNMIKPQIITTNPGTNNSEIIMQAVLVLGKGENEGYEGAAIPARIVCVANASVEELNSYKNKSISALPTSPDCRHSEVYETDNLGDETNFMMTSSTYWENGVKYWSDITADNIRPTTDQATSHPVQIYIERLAARVEVTKYPTNHFILEAEDGDNTKLHKFNLTYIAWDEENNTTKTVENKAVWAEIKGWNVNTLAKQSYGIKQIVNFSSSSAGDDYFFSNLTDWNEGVRSFWSKTATAATSETAPMPEKFYPATSLNLGLGNDVYVLPNTADPLLKGNTARGNDAFRGKPNFARTYTTKILVGVNLTIVDPEATSPGDEKFDLMYYAGTYYTPEALCRSIAQWHNITTGTVGFIRCTGAVNFTASDKNQHFNVKFYHIVDGTTWGEMYDELPGSAEISADPAQYWNGMGYYIVNISNKTWATAKTPAPEMYGVMRNTIYRYSLDQFVGLGTPVPAPDKLTDVENPAYGETFVAAQLSILKWRLVSNSTILQ